MDWCVKPFAEANHHPIAVVDGDATDSILRITANAGEDMTFDASESNDLDNDSIDFHWWIYKEAGSYPGEIELVPTDESKIAFTIPSGASETQIHLIVEVKDRNQIASLYDYRRIVIDVDRRFVSHKPSQR